MATTSRQPDGSVLEEASDMQEVTLKPQRDKPGFSTEHGANVDIRFPRLSEEEAQRLQEEGGCIEGQIVRGELVPNLTYPELDMGNLRFPVDGHPVVTGDSVRVTVKPGDYW